MPEKYTLAATAADPYSPDLVKFNAKYQPTYPADIDPQKPEFKQPSSGGSPKQNRNPTRQPTYWE